MNLPPKSLTGAITLMMSSAAFAQAQPSAQQTTSTTTQQTPDQTTSTTTKSTTTAVPGTPETPAQTQTTTDPVTQTPTAPSESSTTTSTTTSTAAATQPATAADVKTGASVYDSSGGVVGKIASVSGKNAVVSTGSVRATVPISSFAKNDKGLVIAMTKAEVEAAAKKK